MEDARKETSPVFCASQSGAWARRPGFIKKTACA
jgi:hypothetical protein